MPWKLIGDPVRHALDNAPLDDEGELSDETVAALAEGRRDVAEGRVYTNQQVMRELGLWRCKRGRWRATGQALRREGGQP